MYVGRRSSPVPVILAVLAVPVLFAAGIGIRMWVLPARGLAGDVDQFVVWVNGIAVNGWQNAYDMNLSFPAVMAWIWGALAWVEPAFRTVTDASDPAVSALMKIPASLADVGIAAAVGWWFRDRAWAAVAAMAAVLLWPVTWYVSAWWGQVEPVYVLPAVIALLAARARHPSLVAVFLALSVMTNAQALPLVVPFAAWFMATQGLRGTGKAALIAAVTCVLVWLPFVGAGGPTAYLANLAEHRAGITGLSVGAWNPWWIVGELAAGGELADATPVLGPITLHHVGLAIAGLLGLWVFVAVYRRPSPQGLALGLAAITLVAIAWGAFSIAFAANLLFAAPAPGLTLPDDRVAGIVGSGVITLVTLVALLWTGRAERYEHADWDQPLHSLWPTNR
jgi:hypothetical protein